MKYSQSYEVSNKAVKILKEDGRQGLREDERGN